MESESEILQRKLHISAELADRLVAGHLSSLEEVAYVPYAELLKVSGLAYAEAQSLRQIARAYLLNEALGDDFNDLSR